jgi:very-short-patch-repair endonuclease
MTPLESPIEWKFAAAAREVIREMQDQFFLLELPSASFDEVMARWDANMSHTHAGAPQVQCGSHRVDFLFIGYCFDEALAIVAVECDGHDFHEKNKFQAARDKSRDRDLALMGIHVMRFTGSEIHRDAARCVKQVFEFLVNRSTAAFERQHPQLATWTEAYRNQVAEIRT